MILTNIDVYDAIFDTSCRTQTIMSVSSIRSSHKTISDGTQVVALSALTMSIVVGNELKNYIDDQPALSDLNFTVIYWIVFEIFELNNRTTITDAFHTMWSKIKVLTVVVFALVIRLSTVSIFICRQNMFDNKIAMNTCCAANVDCHCM